VEILWNFLTTHFMSKDILDYRSSTDFELNLSQSLKRFLFVTKAASNSQPDMFSLSQDATADEFAQDGNEEQCSTEQKCRRCCT